MIDLLGESKPVVETGKIGKHVAFVPYFDLIREIKDSYNHRLRLAVIRLC